MNPKDFDNRREQAMKDLHEAYQFYLVGFMGSQIYNMADPDTKPQTEDLDLTEAKTILSKFTISGKLV